MKERKKFVIFGAAASGITRYEVALAGVGAIVSVSAFFFPEIFLGKIIYCCDNLTIIAPMKKFLVDSIRAGVFPLWNPYIFSGSPYFADLNVGTLHPFTALYFMMSPFRAVTFDVIASFFVSFIGAYLFGRVMRLGSTASLATAVIYTFSGGMAAYSNNVSMLHTASLLPLSLAVFISYLTNPRAASFVIASIAISLQILAGHPQITFYAFVIMGVITLAMPQDALRQRIASIAKLFSVVLLLTAVQTIPFMEFALNSSRFGLGLAYAASGAFTPAGLIRFILPNAIGDLSGIGAWAQNGVLLGFVGILPILLLLMSYQRNYFWKLFTAIAGIAFLASFGDLSPVFHILFRILPGFSYFRAPENLLIIYTFSVAVLSGFGLEVLDRTDAQKKLKRVITVTFCVVVGLGIGGLFIRRMSSFFSERVVQLIRDQGQILTRFVWENTIIELILICAFLATFYVPVRFRKGIVVALIFVELTIFSRHNILSAAPGFITTNLGSGIPISVMQKDLDGNKERILIDPRLLDNPDKSFPKYRFKSETAWQLSVLKPNLPLLYELPLADGYASMVNKFYAEGVSSQSADPTGVGIPHDERLLDLLGVRYMVTGNDGITHLVRREMACPRIFIDAPSGCSDDGIRVLSYTFDELQAEVMTEGTSTIVFSDAWYPGWQAFIDGKPVPIERYKGVVKSVMVPEGTYRVVFRYDPLSFRTGVTLTIIGLLGVGFIFLRR